MKASDVGFETIRTPYVEIGCTRWYQEGRSEVKGKERRVVATSKRNYILSGVARTAVLVGAVQVEVLGFLSDG